MKLTQAQQVEFDRLFGEQNQPVPDKAQACPFNDRDYAELFRYYYGDLPPVQ